MGLENRDGNEFSVTLEFAITVTPDDASVLQVMAMALFGSLNTVRVEKGTEENKLNIIGDDDQVASLLESLTK